MLSVLNEIIETGRKLVGFGLVEAYFGNISVRMKDRIFITPTRVYWDEMILEDIVEVDMEGVRSEGKPSSELQLHLEIYKAREDVGAIIHTHSIYATALSFLKEEIQPFTEELKQLIKGPLKIAPFAPSGSSKLAQVAVRFLGDRNAVLLGRHGVVAVGRDLREALAVCCVVERGAQIYFLVKEVRR
jgi:L-fuculose-phosphate aldolase